jgi:hypothetical protein
MLAIAGGSIAKVMIEVSLGASIMTHISWPPYAWSHVAGLIGGLIVVWSHVVWCAVRDENSHDTAASITLK